MIDNRLIAKSPEYFTGGQKPFLSADDPAEGVDKLEVYFAGALEVKVSIQADGEPIYRDKLNFPDRFFINSKLTKLLPIV